MKTKRVQKSTISKKLVAPKNDYSNVMPLVKRQGMGIGLTNATTKEVLEYLLYVIQKTQKNIYVVTPNPEMIVLAHKIEDFKTILNSADVAMTDGMQLFNAARFLGIPLKERIIGTNFVERLCEKVNDWPITVGFLGGGPNVAERAAECLIGKFPKLKINFVAEEWSKEGFANAAKYHVSSSMYYGDKKNKNPLPIHNTNYIIPNTVDVLFVAFGAPKQEYWMAEHLNKIPVRVMIGVGGAFDQIVDPSLRPPAWMHSLGLGWLYRLGREPWRVKRQLRLFQFLWMVLQEKFRM